MTREEYIDGVLELHARCAIDAYNFYRNRKELYKREQETESQYIIRCAEFDYDVAVNNGISLHFEFYLTSAVQNND